MQTEVIRNVEYKKVFDAVGLRKEHLIFPIVIQQRGRKMGRIAEIPGITKIPLKKVTHQIHRVINAGISSIVIFGVPQDRDEKGSFAVDKNGVVQQSLRKIRKEFGSNLNLITDVCVCQYNFSGQCGLVNNNKVDNDSTLDLISKIALSHAEAGADIVAPSCMMDGQVYSIRELLKRHGFQKTKILSHSVKQLSSLYTPFRSAAFSTKEIPQFSKIDKSTYQIACSNPQQILREVEADINEGADMVVVKPGLLSLDVVCLIKEKIGFPIAVQNVSGEYSMIKAAAMHGWIEEESWKVNSIASIKRAGADKIISYFSMDIARYLSE